MTPEPAAPLVGDEPQLLILVRDLLFSSKLTSAAKAGNVRYRVVRDAAKLAGLVAPRLIVDLSPPDALAAAIAWKQQTGGHVIGFLPHVAGDAIESARALGIDHVLSNGALSGRVNEIVRTDSM